MLKLMKKPKSRNVDGFCRPFKVSSLRKVVGPQSLDYGGLFRLSLYDDSLDLVRYETLVARYSH